MVSFKPLTKKQKYLMLKEMRLMKQGGHKLNVKRILLRHKWTYLSSIGLIILGNILMSYSSQNSLYQFDIGVLFAGVGAGVLGRDINLTIQSIKVLPFIAQITDSEKINTMIDDYEGKKK